MFTNIFWIYDKSDKSQIEISHTVGKYNDKLENTKPLFNYYNQKIIFLLANVEL